MQCSLERDSGGEVTGDREETSGGANKRSSEQLFGPKRDGGSLWCSWTWLCGRGGPVEWVDDELVRTKSVVVKGSRLRSFSDVSPRGWVLRIEGIEAVILAGSDSDERLGWWWSTVCRRHGVRSGQSGAMIARHAHGGNKVGESPLATHTQRIRLLTHLGRRLVGGGDGRVAWLSSLGGSTPKGVGLAV
jgi:hypothetical protein